MDLIKEPDNCWGGSWTEQKLKAFEAYVNAYLTIMLKQKTKFNGWPNLIYFDGFAGNGQNYISEKGDIKSNDFAIEFENDEEQKVYKGSAERVLSLNKKFDEYYFIDIEKTSIEQLKSRLNQKFNLNNKCHFINGDVNEILKSFSNKFSHKDAALILLDPFGMNINWDSIFSLKDKRVDLWILVPSGVIVNRLLDKKGELKCIKKLEEFFGLDEQKIKSIFYEKKQTINLFGTEEKTEKIDNPIKRIAEIYVHKLKTIFKHVTENPLVLLNSKNVPIYHFVFASNNEAAYRIASQIIQKKQK